MGLGLPHRTRCFFIFFRAGTSLVLMIPLGAGGRGGGLGAVRRWGGREEVGGKGGGLGAVRRWGEGKRVRGCEVGVDEEGQKTIF